MTNETYIATARDQYQCEGETEIDDDAVVSRSSDNGAYVQAWVWVADESLGDDSGGSECDPDAPASEKCVTCKTQTDADGICPRCSLLEKVDVLIDLCANDIYTDAAEYAERVQQLRELVGEVQAMRKEANARVN